MNNFVEFMNNFVGNCETKFRQLFQCRDSYLFLNMCDNRMFETWGMLELL